LLAAAGLLFGTWLDLALSPGNENISFAVRLPSVCASALAAAVWGLRHDANEAPDPPDNGVCPSCGGIAVRRPSGCLSPLIAGAFFLGLYGLEEHLGDEWRSQSPIAGVALAAAFVVAAISSFVTVGSFLWGRHKCRYCGHGWR
jgi:hypothetical protein